MGYALDDIRRFIITHLHYDHYTLAVPLRREFGTPIALSSGERETFETIRAPTTLTLGTQMRALRSHGATELAAKIEASGAVHEIDRSQWEGPDDWIEQDAVFDVGSRRLVVIPTPGHTSGHLSFADLEHKLFFAGDHVLPHITPSIGFEAVSSASPLGDFQASLRRIADLPDMVLLPAHGPATDSTHKRVEELLQHHEVRLADSMGAVAAGAATAYDVARSLSWTSRQRRFAELDDFNRMLAITETAAHLDALVDRHLLDRRSTRGVQRYDRPGKRHGSGL